MFASYLSDITCICVYSFYILCYQRKKLALFFVILICKKTHCIFGRYRMFLFPFREINISKTTRINAKEIIFHVVLYKYFKYFSSLDVYIAFVLQENYRQRECLSMDFQSLINARSDFQGNIAATRLY